MSNKITVADYLLTRLKELGIDDVFGVPGDYNMLFLDYVSNCKGLQWVGNCNELNAAYACDGYARLKGAGAVVTTFGVGELSAINGIAGAYAELVPVVKITGMPALSIQEKKALMHHTLGGGDFSTFLHAYENVTIEQVVLDGKNATEEIDRILKICWIKKRPVYIGLPVDVVEIMVDSPKKKLDLSYPKSDSASVKECINKVAALIKKSKQPVILADICALRHAMGQQICQLLKETKLPFATMNMGKCIIDESHPQFIGSYVGAFGSKGVQEYVESSDCVISIGTLLSDFNTGGFTLHLDASSTIAIHSDHIKVHHATYSDIYFNATLPALTKALSSYQYQGKIPKQTASKVKPNHIIQQDYFWDRMQHFIAKNSIVLTETGTSTCGLANLELPDGTDYINQPLWGSIGYTLPALLGACIAQPNRTAILFEGDGSFQLTGQEISTMLKQHLTPIIFLLNNSGYSIERVIHGEKMPYNDVQPWNYSKLPRIFGKDAWTAKVKTPDELEKILKELPKHSNQLRFVEVVMGKYDYPEMLKNIVAALEKMRQHAYGKKTRG